MILPPGDKVFVDTDPAELAPYAHLRCEATNADGSPTRQLRINPLARPSLATSPRKFPVGSLIYKVLLPQKGRLTRVVGMRKRERGYDTAGGDWAYLIGESMKKLETGRIERCRNCHAKAAADDFVFNLTRQ